MTGENFTRFSRKNERLERLLSLYRQKVDKARNLYCELCYGNGTYEAYYKVRDEYENIREQIWTEAFYHYGRNWNLANNYIKNHC